MTSPLKFEPNSPFVRDLGAVLKAHGVTSHFEVAINQNQDRGSVLEATYTLPGRIRTLSPVTRVRSGTHVTGLSFDRLGRPIAAVTCAGDGHHFHDYCDHLYMQISPIDWVRCSNNHLEGAPGGNLSLFHRWRIERRSLLQRLKGASRFHLSRRFVDVREKWGLVGYFDRLRDACAAAEVDREQIAAEHLRRDEFYCALLNLLDRYGVQDHEILLLISHQHFPMETGEVMVGVRDKAAKTITYRPEKTIPKDATVTGWAYAENGRPQARTAILSTY